VKRKYIVATTSQVTNYYEIEALDEKDALKKFLADDTPVRFICETENSFHNAFFKAKRIDEE